MRFTLPFFQGTKYTLLPQGSPPTVSPPSPPLTPTSTGRRRCPSLFLLISFGLLLILFTLGRLHPDTSLYMDDTVNSLKGWLAGAPSYGPVPVWLGGEAGANPHGKESKVCRGWDHEGPVEEDPLGCVKSRQYRQTVAVLEREERNKHDHWGFTHEHNLATLRNLTRCFLPAAHPDFTPCHEKPLVIAGWWYAAESLTKATTGEVIWMRAIIKMLNRLGYSFLALGPYGNWQTVAEMMPDVYLTLWNSDVGTVSCLTDPRSVTKEHYVPPEGAEDLSIGVPDEERGVIPLWALNVVDYWGAKPREISQNAHYWNLTRDGDWTYQPLGQQWIATPWPLPGHAHLPYSIEEECLEIPVILPEDRRNAALIYGKRSAYFHYSHVSPPEFWTNLSRDNDFDLILTATVEEGQPLPEGLETIGKQTPEDFEVLVASVKAMVGVGVPGFSPSVYDALCQATPVVLPYFSVEKIQSEWRHYSGWSQHGPAAAIGPPYVYSYLARNFTQLEDAVRTAVNTPIGRYIPETMHYSFAMEKLHEYLTRPQERMMAKVVAANDGQVQQLKAGLRERCYELERCKPVFEARRRPALPAGRFE